MPAHIADLIAQDPQAGWIFIFDQLNTHQSESLVRLVATRCQLSQDLGIKGKSGILAFVAITGCLPSVIHPIGFALSMCPSIPPQRDQIECWFSILVRRLLKRGNFTSTADLKQQILKFINYFNRTLAKPFLWKFKGFDHAVQAG